MWIYFNNNPSNQRVGDCSVRALSKALNKDWEDVYIGLCAEGLFYHDMPNSNYVWGMYLRQFGFEQKSIPSICPDCITVGRFAEDHPEGTYILATQNHVVCVKNGNVYDAWDSTNEVVLYFFEKEI